MTTRSLTWKIAAGASALGAVALIANGAATRPSAPDPVARGKYLVETIGCADCHTPLSPGAHGPERDPARHLSGHPQELVMPAAPELPEGPWQILASETATAWFGPWGTSFTANLTPDRETGL